MVDGEPESSDSLRTFGAVVQGLREYAGLSREEFGELVRFSKHTVASVELGRRMPDPEFVTRAEEALGMSGVLQKAAGRLERQPGLAAWFRRWALLEQVAITLYTYECRMIPGLLQTEAYARQLFVDELPRCATSRSRLSGPRVPNGKRCCMNVRTPRSASFSKSTCSFGAPAGLRSREGSSITYWRSPSCGTSRSRSCR